MNIGSSDPLPSNREPANANASLQCITDLVDCCGTESGTVRTERGNWYFPDAIGTTISFGSGTRFLVNRGPNEAIGQQQFTAQFVSFEDSVIYQKEVVSAVSYPVLLIPILI